MSSRTLTYSIQTIVEIDIAVGRFNIIYFVYSLSYVLYSFSLHDALPIFLGQRPRGKIHGGPRGPEARVDPPRRVRARRAQRQDRKSTRLNASHTGKPYADVCLKKKSERR